MITMTSLSLLTASAGTCLALPPVTAADTATAAEVRLVSLDPPQPEAPPRVVVRSKVSGDNQPTNYSVDRTGSPGAVYQFTQHDDDETFVIKIEDGEVVELKLNGEKLDRNHFTFDNGEITILDDDGNVIKTHNIHRFGPDLPTPPGVPHVLRFGQGGNFVFDKDADARFFTDNAGNQVTWDFEPKVMVGINQGVPGPALRYHLNIADDQPCILIEKVIKGLPADRAGLHRYDVVVKADGKHADDGVLRKLLAEKEPGQSVTFEVIRKGKPIQLKVELQAYDGSKLVPDNFFSNDNNNENDNVFITGPGGPGGEWFVAPGAPDAPTPPGAAPAPHPLGEFRFRAEDFADPDKAPEAIRQLRERIERHADRVQLDGDRLMILKDAEKMQAEAMRMAEEARAQIEQASKAGVEKLRRDVLPEAAERLDKLEQRLEKLEGSLSDRLESLFDRLDSLSEQLKDRAADSDEDEI